MKNLKFLLVLPGMLAIQTALAQNDSHLKLSNENPAAGEKITVTYNPVGTPVDGKKNIEAAVFYMDSKDSPAADIDLKPDGNSLKGEIWIPAVAKAFYIKISADDKVDNNNEKGYMYLVYKDKQPVEGAYASEGYLLLSGMGTQLAKIKTDADAGLDLYKKEFALYPNSSGEYSAFYYYMIARKPQYKAEFNQKLAALEKSTDEKDLVMASSLLSAKRNTKGADSLNKIIISKFPNGTAAKNEIRAAVYKETDLHKKDSLFTVFAQKYPESPSDKTTLLDGMRAMIAWAYLKKADMDGYKKYESQLKDKSVMIGYWNDVAWNWALAGEHLTIAEMISKQAVDMVTEKMKNPVASAFASPNDAKKNALNEFNANADTYAYVLWKENKSAEALPYMKQVYDQTSNEANSIEHYALILAGVGQYDKAFDIIVKGMKEGQSSPVLKEELKKDYIKVKGSNAGYDKFFASLDNVTKNKVLAGLIKTMINQPAPAFTLKDFDGKPVSLADLKGKIVIVDFWATWCGPCKASFPGMQMAVTKYKDDPNVKFLFVDTWENGENYLGGVKKFIADNKYTFHVLMDEKGGDGRQSKVVSAFGVDGIPTKFIIDKSGNIRFKYVGYSGTPEAMVEEVTDMIDLAGNPETVASVQKVSTSK